MLSRASYELLVYSRCVPHKTIRDRIWQFKLISHRLLILSLGIYKIVTLTVWLATYMKSLVLRKVLNCAATA